jgi:hypothetical protein
VVSITDIEDPASIWEKFPAQAKGSYVFKGLA